MANCTYTLTDADESNPSSLPQRVVHMPVIATHIYLGGEKRTDNKEEGSFLNSRWFNIIFTLGKSHRRRSVCCTILKSLIRMVYVVRNCGVLYCKTAPQEYFSS